MPIVEDTTGPRWLQVLIGGVERRDYDNCAECGKQLQRSDQIIIHETEMKAFMLKTIRYHKSKSVKAYCHEHGMPRLEALWKYPIWISVPEVPKDIIEKIAVNYDDRSVYPSSASQYGE